MFGHCALNCVARWKIGNIGNIVVHQQLNRQQIGNRPATFLEPIPYVRIATLFLAGTALAYQEQCQDAHI